MKKIFTEKSNGRDPARPLKRIALTLLYPV